MAKPIKHTPVLTGKDAVTFYDRLAENKSKKAEPSYLQNIRQEAQKLKSLLKN